MTEPQRCQEMDNYFNTKLFEPAIKYGEDNNIKEIAQGARYTRMRMEQLDSKRKLQYFWSAIQGTDKSIEFSKLLKDNGSTCIANINKIFDRDELIRNKNIDSTITEEKALEEYFKDNEDAEEIIKLGLKMISDLKENEQN